MTFKELKVGTKFRFEAYPYCGPYIKSRDWLNGGELFNTMAELKDDNDSIGFYFTPPETSVICSSKT